MMSLIDFSARPDQHEPTLPIRAIWRIANGSIPVRVLAYSLGATIAFCIIGLGDTLEADNYSATWLPTTQLQFP
jgi:hypothetical protein